MPGDVLCLAEQPGQIISKEEEEQEASTWMKNDSMITHHSKKSRNTSSSLRPVSSARVIIDRPTKAITMHLKPLYIKVHIEGVPVSGVLVDGGAAVNILPWAVLRKLGKNEQDLLPTDLCISNFTGGISRGGIPCRHDCREQDSNDFFVVEARAAYNALVGRDWIHAWMVVPSSLHQLLVF